MRVLNSLPSLLTSLSIALTLLSTSSATPHQILPRQDNDSLDSNGTVTTSPSNTNLEPIHRGTKFYNLTLTRGTVNSNGEPRAAILVNGQTPGPLIESVEGQQLSITVYNQLGEPTAMHWHGIIQYGTVWADGVPGVTQYPIANGEHLTYNFTPVQYGQYWYHSHYHAQLTDGARGPMIIYPAANRTKPFSLISTDKTAQKQMIAAEKKPRIFQAADWSAYTGEEYDDIFRESGLQPVCVDSLLVNGRGQIICPDPNYLKTLETPATGSPLSTKGCANITSRVVASGNFDPAIQFPDRVPEDFFGGTCTNNSAPLTVFEVDPAAGYASFNLIHSGGLHEQLISIDGHKMIVYEVDGHYVEPQTVDVLLMSIGARYSALVKLDTSGDWTIRTANPIPSQYIAGYSVMSYTANARTSCGNPSGGLPALCGSKTYTTPPTNQPKLGFAGNLLNNAVLLDVFGLKPFPPIAPPQHVDHTIYWDMTQDNKRIWSIDRKPLLPWREQDVPAIISHQKMLDAGVATAIENGSVVDIISNIPNGQPPHPFHKHENRVWVIGQGQGAFNWSTTAEAMAAVPQNFNLNNPSFRDTYRTLPALQGGRVWQVLRYQVDHPSFTFFHCHITYHLSAGMSILLVEGLDVGTPFVPQSIRDAAGSATIVTSNPNPTLPDGSIVEG